jgi:transcriptional regulator with XRE-family HTH domain
MKQPSIGPKPYEKLGQQLKQYRQSNQESLAEVSGAVEVDEHILERFEAGIDRPDEEILNLLINHFQLKENTANQLWDLAGYGSSFPEDAIIIEEAMAAAKQLIMVLATDNRALYSDGVSIDCNKTGIQMTFTQTIGQNKVIQLSKLGMSYEQAEEVIKALGIALTYAKFSHNKLLLPPDKKV